MKPILILQHQTPERPAYLATWLSKNNIKYITFNAGNGQEFPSSINEYSALAVMGGGMSANDPLLSNRQAEILILQAMYRDIPVIGHCLGGQLMAKALGGVISASPKPEIGWQPIRYTDSTITNEWFGSNPTNTVIHWHYESFSVPNGATLLASSDACPNQAFAIDKHLAMQFHIEIDEEKATAWTEDEDPKWVSAKEQYDTVQDKDEIINGIIPNIANHKATADSIYTNWMKTTEWSEVIKN
jgi:GMP synthase-like glutamine amidotransferase